MEKKDDEKLERILFDDVDLDGLMQAWALLEDTPVEDVLDARDRLIETFGAG